MDWNALWEVLRTWLLNSGVKIVVSAVVLVVSFRLVDWIGKKIVGKAERRLEEKKAVDKTLSRTLSYVFRIGVKILVVLVLIGYLGLDTSGLAAVFTSLGVGVGLAVNGALSNMAGGVLLLITRPFRVDDYIAACDYEGTVEEIRVCNTRLRTSDNKVVYLPNGTLSSSQIVNYSEKGTRRVDLTFSIAYSDDFEKAQTLLKRLLAEHPLVFDDPAPTVRMTKHGADAIEICVLAWCRSSDYWTVRFDMTEQVKKAFDENGFHIPFRQLDVHVNPEEKEMEKP